MKRLVVMVAALIVVAVTLLWWPGLSGDEGAPAVARDFDDAGLIARGQYLATLANCRACHTEPGQADYAGGRAIPTPFGRFYAPNITPDPEHGIGHWDADDFWRALHHGRSADGRPLYPVFPYTNYTRITREDSDALWAWLRQQPPVDRPNRDHALRFPYDQRWMLAGWRALFFRPGVYSPDPEQDAVWNRGAYLVEGPGHCSACHAARNALGAPREEGPAGGLVLDWYAPALTSPAEAGVQGWQRDEVIALLHAGHGRRGAALGPMAEVVYESLQHWQPADQVAMARYLQSLPERPPPADTGGVRVPASEVEQMMARGASLYAEHCVACHGEQGEGRPPAAPPLAGNRAVTLASPVNLVQVLLHGGYPPGTEANPRPFGMPPYGVVLSDEEIAEVLTYLRGSWGHQAAPVSAVDVRRLRGDPGW